MVAVSATIEICLQQKRLNLPNTVTVIKELYGNHQKKGKIK
jgi:hypothetical protein